MARASVNATTDSTMWCPFIVATPVPHPRPPQFSVLSLCLYARSADRAHALSGRGRVPDRVPSAVGCTASRSRYVPRTYLQRRRRARLKGETFISHDGDMCRRLDRGADTPQNGTYLPLVQ